MKKRLLIVALLLLLALSIALLCACDFLFPPKECKHVVDENNICTLCGEEHFHSFGEWKIFMTATCQSEGKDMRICDECWYTEYRSTPIDENAHTFSSEHYFDAENHWNNSICPHGYFRVNVEPHTYGLDDLCTECKCKSAYSLALQFAYDETTESYEVTGLGDTMVTDIVIPATYDNYPVKTIGHEAFYGRDSLISIDIPDSITTIEDSAFCLCKRLTSVSISENSNLKHIGFNAFACCENLLSIIIPENVTLIDNGAFQRCYKLLEVYDLSPLNIQIGLSDNGCIAGYAKVVHTSLSAKSNLITTDEKYIFYDDNGMYSLVGYSGNQTQLMLPTDVDDNYYSIGQYAFSNFYNLKEVIIPEGITEIAYSAFSECKSLTKIIIPEGVTSIGSNAFSNCSNLLSITIPKSVTYIGDWAFSSCCSLVEVYNLSSLEITKGSQDHGGVAKYAKIVNTSLSIKSNITLVENDYAFYNDNGWYYLVRYLGNQTQLTLPIFNKYIIGEYAFFNYKELTSVTIPDCVRSIDDWAFRNCVGLTNVVLPDSISTIKLGTFRGCSSLTNITIPDSITTIDTGAFSGCSSLTSVTISERISSISDSAFCGCNSLDSISVDAGNRVYHSDGNCLIETDTKTLILGCANSIIPTDGSVTIIGSYAFEGSGLTDIIIPQNVTTIDYYAFKDCANLTSITIPDSVTSIGESAFSGCSNLISITIPDSIKSISDNTFSDCSSLTNITIPDSVMTIGAGAFRYCDNLTNVTIPSKIKYIKEETFCCCNLSTINFTGTVAQWLNIGKVNGWDLDTPSYTIYCTDGTITKDGVITHY